jgi:Na+/H+ antiporter NhaB
MLYLATARCPPSATTSSSRRSIAEIKAAFDRAISHAQFEWLAVAINTGTNIPSVATPNGQAAFLFMLTSTSPR